MTDAMLSAEPTEPPSGETPLEAPPTVPEPGPPADAAPPPPAPPERDELPFVPTVELTLPALTGFEKVARNAATALAEQMGFSLDRIEDLKTAVAEACMNAAEHGNGGNIAAKVHVILRMGDEQLEVMVNDQAERELPNPLPKPGLPDGTRGWGLFFITQLMDEVTFRRLPEGGNQVHMIVRLTAPDARATEATEAADAAAIAPEDAPAAGAAQAVPLEPERAVVDKAAESGDSETDEYAAPPADAPAEGKE